MNKQKLLTQLKRVGVNVQSLELGHSGYVLELRLDSSKGMGWDEFENTPIDGLEIAKMRRISEYSRQVVLLPTIEREFKTCIQKYQQVYGMNSYLAFRHLKTIIEEHGSTNAKFNFTSYSTKKFKGRTM